MDLREIAAAEPVDEQNGNGSIFDSAQGSQDTIFEIAQGSPEIQQVDIGAQDIENFENGYKLMESAYQKLITGFNPGFRKKLLSSRFVDGVRRLQVYADEVESSNFLEPLHSDYPMCSKPSYQRSSSEPSRLRRIPRLETLPTEPLEVLKDAIGASCGNYAPLPGRFGDMGDGTVSGTKRKMCQNNFCATRRHKVTVRLDAERVSEWICSNEAEDFLPLVWVHLHGGDEIKLTGYDIRMKLLANCPLDPILADALVRLLREHEARTLFLRDAYQGRHYVSPHWGINVAHGNACMESSINQFMFPAPRYDIKRCSIVLTLSCDQGEWSCYAFDFSRSTISIMDPNIRQPVPEYKIVKHTEFTGRLLTHVVFCMRMATGNPTIGQGKWIPKLLLARGRRHTAVNSGIEAINCMRWYNGNSVCTPPKDRQAIHTRKDLALQLLSMDTNASTAPVLRFALGSHSCHNSFKVRKEGDDPTNAKSLGSKGHE